ncbi:hypothetical protein V2647_11205 [Tenacibaculum maritimum]|uniref:hypothetical protein n=1 Tax=Tenacibaculum maritimum TaxID=107401 RepID=UPI0012E432D6|nr:hypothetical protein [Tenacibaculum maritimum]MCD9583444.1 hypothetical protein [Tenacibaculum maritimum]MCD9637508.1 hypothetical protein [Tenacibaculum maritimum]CAA0149444.1 hypothetical protein DPIF89300162_10101 [Tenacibaculum maritimum]CAA0184399.1 hypothetical protein TMP248_170074 [Tenacibaculum maritimum]CAA0262811.1 hypothetical protein USCSE301_930006 [Tenacibaculum maritimum]
MSIEIKTKDAKKIIAKVEAIRKGLMTLGANYSNDYDKLSMATCLFIIENNIFSELYDIIDIFNDKIDDDDWPDEEIQYKITSLKDASKIKEKLDKLD